MGCALAAAVALVPVVRMVLLVREGSALQYSDYWLLIEHYVRHDGSLDLGGLFDFQHQNHPIVVPMVVYWANGRLFAGSNVTLGVFVVALGVAMVGTTALIAARSHLRPLAQGMVVVLAAALLFTPNGAWNFAIGMSGTAWLGAGLLGLVAVHLRSRDRPVLALLVAVAGAGTYATGLMVWPAIAAVGACRRPAREWWREWPYVVGFVMNLAWYQQVQTTGLAADLAYPGLVEAVRTLARLLVLPLGLTGTVALVAGLVVLIGTVGLVAWFAVVSPDDAAAAWVGVTVFGLLATASLAVGRHAWIGGHGDQNRYSSVPALALIGGSGLLLLLAHRPRPGAGRPEPPRVLRAAPLVVVAALGLLATASGTSHVRSIRAMVPDQELREVALHLDLVDGTPYLAGFPLANTELLEDLHHHPFVDGWDLDCGLIDRPLSLAGVRATRGGVIESIERLDRLDGAWELTGTIEDRRPVRCVVFTDGTGQVVGASTLAASAEGTRFVGIARPGSEVYRAVALFEEGATPMLVREISTDA